MFKNKYITVILYALCGIMCAMPFIFNNLWFLAWIAYVPVLINEFTRELDKEKPYKKAWLRGLSFFYPFGITTFYWIAELYPMDFVGFTPLVGFLVVACGILLFPLFQSLFTSFNVVFLCFLKKNRVKQWMYPLAAASMWIIQEWLQTLTWAGIPWGKLAMGQVGVLQNIQSVSILGPYLISFLIITTAGYIALFLINLKNKETVRRAAAFLYAAILLFTSNFIYGQIAINSNSEYNGEFKAAAIQANVQTEEKWQSDPYGVMDTHKELLLKASNDGAQLVLFAETAFPFDIENEFVNKYVQEMSKESNVDFILGCFTHENENSYNSTVLVTNENGITDTVYIKQKIVPFGEFLPMESLVKTIFPFLGEINQFENMLSPGQESIVMDTDYGKVGSIICFDSIYETVAWESVRNGAEIIMISTNDSWFHDSAATRQHTANAILRAIELDRYVVRSGNTGISSIINNKGVTMQKLDALKQGYIVDTVKTSNSRTIYSYVGNILILVAFVLIIPLSISLRIKTKKIEDREERARSVERFNQSRYGNSNKKKKKK